MGVRIGHRGDRWVELGAWHAVSGEALRFCDLTGALLFLREQVAPPDLRALRGLLTRDDAMVRRLDDAVVLRLVAHRLHQRTLKAVAWHERRYGFVETLAVYSPPRIELPAPTLRESALVADPPAIAPPRPSPAAPRDEEAEAQAFTLREAARSGAPFCEICERSPGPEASQPAPPDELFPATSDPAAQARTLREAASEGAPFCALCRR